MQTVALAIVLVGTAVAQSTTSVVEPAATGVAVVGGQSNGQLIAGQHVGAAQSYQVLLSGRTGNSLGQGGDQFFFNESSNQLMDESLVTDIPLPCYIIEADQAISNNSGPLECGALANDETRNTIVLGNDGSVNFIGVQSWWICDVNATQPYGIIPDTVVGGFTTSEPSGPGIRNCAAIDGLKLGGGSGPQSSSSTTSMSSTSSSASSSSSSSSSSAGSSSATTTQTNTLTTDRLTTMTPPSSTNTLTTDRMTTMTSPTATSSQGTSSASSTSASASIASSTGAASRNMINDISKVGMLVAGGLAFLL